MKIRSFSSPEFRKVNNPPNPSKTSKSNSWGKEVSVKVVDMQDPAYLETIRSKLTTYLPGSEGKPDVTGKNYKKEVPAKKSNAWGREVNVKVVDMQDPAYLESIRSKLTKYLPGHEGVPNVTGKGYKREVPADGMREFAKRLREPSVDAPATKTPPSPRLPQQATEQQSHLRPQTPPTSPRGDGKFQFNPIESDV